MIPANLAAALTERKKYVDGVSCVSESITCRDTFESTTNLIAFDSTKFNKLSFKSKSETGLTGLENQGGTCYLNSLLQTLFHCPELRNTIIAFHYDPERHGDEADCLTRQMQKLFVELLLSEKASVSTRGLTTSFGWTTAEVFQQQDAQECMAVIFDYIITQCVGTPVSDFFSTFWLGECADELTCQVCHASRCNMSTFRDLQLQVRGHKTLHQSLQSFFQKEFIEGVDCPSCQQRTLHSKGFALKTLPHFLSLQLKRFDLNYTTLRREKVNDEFSFPTVLDMASYIHTTSSTSTSSDSSDLTLYDLLAILIHSGSAYAGHYYCYLKNHNSGKQPSTQSDTADSIGAIADKEWLCFNDSTVTYASRQEIERILGIKPLDETSDTTSSSSSLNDLSNHKSTSAYMLLYSRVIPSNSINSDISGSASTSPESDSKMIPCDLLEWIRTENARYSTLKAEYEAERAFITISVQHRESSETLNSLTHFRVHEDTTVDAFTDMVYEKLFLLCPSHLQQPDLSPAKTSSGIEDELSSGTVSCTHPHPPNRDCIRLRIFDSIKGLLLEPLGTRSRGLDFTVAQPPPSGIENASDSITLKTVRWPSNSVRRLLQVEVKQPNEKFDLQPQESIPIYVAQFTGTSVDASSQRFQLGGTISNAIPSLFDKPVGILVPANTTLKQLIIQVVTAVSKHKIKISAALDINARYDSIADSDAVTAVVCNMSCTSGAVTRLLPSDDPVASHVHSHDVLCVELLPMITPIAHDIGISCSAADSNMLAYFDSVQNNISLTITGDPSILSSVNSTNDSFQVHVDQRQPLSALKQQLSVRLRIPSTSFRLHRGAYIDRRHTASSATHDTNPASSNSTLVAINPLNPLLDSLSRTLNSTGAEIKQLQCSMLECKIEDGSSLSVIEGTPLQEDQFRLHFGTIATCDVSEAADLTRNEMFTYIGEIIVSKTTPIPDLKRNLFLQHPQLWKFATVETDTSGCPIDASLVDDQLPLRLHWFDRSAELDSFDSIKHGILLRDCRNALESTNTLSESLGKTHRLADYQILLAEVGDACRGLLTDNHVLVTLQEWRVQSFQQSELMLPRQIYLSKNTTFADLKKVISQLQYSTANVVQSISYLITKPFAWQLKDITSIPSLKWDFRTQPLETDTLAGPPWRVAERVHVLFTNQVVFEDKVLPMVLQKQQQDNYGSSATGGAAKEEGFRILRRNIS